MVQNSENKLSLESIRHLGQEGYILRRIDASCCSPLIVPMTPPLSLVLILSQKQNSSKIIVPIVLIISICEEVFKSSVFKKKCPN